MAAHSNAGRTSAAAWSGDAFGQAGGPRQPGPQAAGRRGAVPRHHRLRRHGRPAARQRHPLAAQLHPARPARPGEEPHPAQPDRPARRRKSRSCPGCEIHDDPLAPLCGACRARIAREGDHLPIAWLPREARFVEKLATPDVTIADMIGDIDPIKAAQAGLKLADELTMHYGLLPRANRGIFAINELPDLAGKIQVGLFNILQEGDVQIKGYPVRLRLDVLLVFTREPRGLHGARQDHHAAQGPHRLGDPHALPGARARTRWRSPRRRRGSTRPGGVKVEVPAYVREVVEEVAFQARARSQDRQALRRQPAAADHDARERRLERRAARAGERRDADRAARHRPLRGAALDHRQVRAGVRRRAEGRRAGRARADSRPPSATCSPAMFDGVDTRPIVEWFDLGGTLPLSDTTSADEVVSLTRGVQGLRELAERTGVRRGRAAPRRWPRRSTSCSKASTRRGRSAAATSAAMRAGTEPAPRRPARREEPPLDEEIRMPGGEEEVLQLRD